MIPAVYYGLTALLTAAFVWRARRHARRVERLSAPLDAEGRARELRAARLWSASAIAAQFALLIGYGLLRAHLRIVEPWWRASGWYMAALTTISQAQYVLEKRLRGLQGTALEFLALSGRQLLAFAAAFAGAMGLFLALSRGGARLLEAVGLLARYPAHRALLGALPLVVSGAATLALSYVWAPMLVRLAFPCERLTDPQLVTVLERCFAVAGLPAPSLWLLRVEKFSMHNAMVAGLRSGRGWLRASLFLTPSLARGLSPEEFEAVMLHEVSHIALRHQLKRTLLIAALIPGLLAPLVLAARRVTPLAAPRWAPLLAAAPFLIFFAAQALLRRWQVRWHEMDADCHAVLELRAGLEPLVAGLAKLMAMNDMTSSRADPTALLSVNYAHPTVDDRARVLRERAARRAAGRPLRLWLDPWRALVSR